MALRIGLASTSDALRPMLAAWDAAYSWIRFAGALVPFGPLCERDRAVGWVPEDIIIIIIIITILIIDEGAVYVWRGGCEFGRAG
ncbi:uncharacterized protein CC84DRAFT_452508 [Paraphaeosphaeria sporulosa]|uniref:Uncharacterized protein n=1 Tax=Paraphaeosphaeria sporulosa TaxID=1460663 RepID=A0A177CQB8_9PLEO|nr:uncharacterized protein CC84DRAFT_452508 [Paraphaeosphaeria sporulosa]OAG09714.1 hypothetical protein CC84DRAFT_452508 [Paraphaeosphaeria sporulosa]